MGDVAQHTPTPSAYLVGPEEANQAALVPWQSAGAAGLPLAVGEVVASLAEGLPAGLAGLGAGLAGGLAG